MAVSVYFVDVLRLLSGGRRKGRHGEGQAGQQEDSLQSSARTRGSTLPHVEPQEHGEPR